MIVIKGRQRIGKSRLCEEFADDMIFFSMAGLAPTKETIAQQQRDEFARQLSEQTGLPEMIGVNYSIYYSKKYKQAVVLYCSMKFPGWVQKTPHF